MQESVGLEEFWEKSIPHTMKNGVKYVIGLFKVKQRYQLWSFVIL